MRKHSGGLKTAMFFSGMRFGYLYPAHKKHDPNNENDGNIWQETLEIEDSWSGFPGSRLTFAKSVA